MYEVVFPHATTFAFSRFMSAAPADGDVPASELLLPNPIEASSSERE